MAVSHASLWKLSHSELAGLCQQMGHGSTAHPDPALSEEARRLSRQWADVLAAINPHQDGAAERQAGMAAALRKRTIELALKSGVGPE